MKIGIYCPYFGQVLGGGERYLLTIARCLINQNHQVDIFWPDETVKKQAAEKFQIDLARVNFIGNDFIKQGNLLKRFLITRQYDVIFYMSDGSLPFLFARKNLIHFQIPFTKVGGSSFTNRIKKLFINDFFCNSKFTKKFIDKEFAVSSCVVYPPVAVDDFKLTLRLGGRSQKENIILSVGRFTKVNKDEEGARLLHEKKQQVLIDVFKDLVRKKKLKGWQLKLVGGAFDRDLEFVNQLKKDSRGFDIEILPNLDFNQLKSLYGKAKIYWHAAGYGEDENKFPERSEHFGIVVVEAMAAGLVPVVVNQGGLKEIIENNQTGFLWQEKNQLLEMTYRLIKDEKLRQQISLQAKARANDFDQNNFCKNINELLEA